MTQERVTAEASALWQAVFGEPPPVRDSGALMIKLILESLPEVSYDRFSSGPLSQDGFVRMPGTRDEP
jgi:hypothetical protein